ncbi:hypothetical protein D8674_008148 [Pyrus ussuriensis x Pyrus communis]|uniref:CST complex subunit TEN1 n=1 Tax=Pyrus ussuriensis x Pyrus communis TaxID=2448454 RepID=A0A5N5HS89_9ROSA|nr:hypothetical protein D8674_008148 [Pyrus ussuriensis x Pyrus communis]
MTMRLRCLLQDYFVETANATIVDESERLKIDTKHLRELSFRVGSIYQFIGELLIQPDNEVNIIITTVGRSAMAFSINIFIVFELIPPSCPHSIGHG